MPSHLRAFLRPLRALLPLVAIMACRDSAAIAQAAAIARADSVRADSLRRDSLAAIVRADSLRRVDSIRVVDSVRAATIPAVRDSIRRARRRASSDSVPWPAPPTPPAGALLPNNRIVAYYGNPLSKRMGILGQIPPAEMLAKLERTAAEWAKADSTKPVLPALHLIVTVAQGSAGRDGKYRLRMSDSLIERVARWAEERNWLLFLDVQTGQSTVADELPRLVPYLKRPYVHLALDPEFSMKNGRKPGRHIGTMDAAEVNVAVDLLARIVAEEKLPPKVLVVHRFTDHMLTNAAAIRRDPTVQVVIDMDGFGAPELKRSTWRRVIQREPVQYAGFKLFYNPRNDSPLMKPADVIRLFPSPLYIQYQ